MDTYPYPKYEEFFFPISEAIHKFVELHGLLLEKYLTEEPLWKLLFAHPQGGVGMISIAKRTSDSVDVVGNWWYDDFEKFIRYSMNNYVQNVFVDSEAVTNALESSLKHLLSEKFGEWQFESESFEKYWKPYLTDEHKAHLIKYPELKL